MEKNFDNLQYSLMNQSFFVGKECRDLEEIVLACFVNFPDSFFRVADQISVREFSDTMTKYVYLAVKELSEVSKIDLATVTNKLIERKYTDIISKKYNGADLLAALNTWCERVEDDGHLEEYVKLLNGYAKRRELNVLAENIIAKCNDMQDPMDVINSINEKIVDIQEMGYVEDFDLDKANRDVYQSLEPLNSDIPIVRTYISAIDEMIYCIEPTEIFVIAAAPSMGKTSFALTMFKNNILNNVRCSFFSLEMSTTQLLNRMYASESHVELSKIRSRYLTEEDRNNLNKTIGLFESKKDQFFIDHKSRKLSHIANKIRKQVIRNKVSLVIIDYLQLISCDIGKPVNREQEIATISRVIKELASELNIVIAPLSQINRGIHARANKRPTLSDLRESGAIEQDADIVGFVHRPAYFDISNGIPDTEFAEFIIGKGRSCGIGTADVLYKSKYTQFISSSKADIEEAKINQNIDLPTSNEF